MSPSHEHCPECGRQIRLYDSTACDDGRGQGWCIAHLPHDHPQASLNMRLVDGRHITVDDVTITESTAGYWAGSLQRMWDEVVADATFEAPDRYSRVPIFLIPPISRRADMPALPRWLVRARLISQPMTAQRGVQLPDGSSISLGGGSNLLLVFFCNDIASRPITALIRDHLNHMDETAWRAHAEDFEH